MRKKALVVDNDFFFVEFISELLEGRGFDITKTYDGKEAMEKLETDSFDLMFADIVMLRIDGWQLIKYVRKRFVQAPFPIVAVSGTIVEQLDQLEQIGADFYIIKGPLEKMKHQVGEFLDDLERREGVGEKEKLVYDPGGIDPRRESAELIDSLRFQKAIFESIGLGLIVVDQDGRIMQANELAMKIIDCQPQDIMNQLIPSVFPRNGRKQLVETMRKVVKHPHETSAPCRVEFDEKRIKTIVSLLHVDARQVGWIVSMEEVVG